MAEYVKLGALELGVDTGHNITRLDFPPPEKEIVYRKYSDFNGEEVVSSRYHNSVRTIVMEVEGSSKENLLTLLRAIHTELRKKDLVLEYKSNNATDSNYSDVITGALETGVDFGWVHNNLAVVTLKLVCKPFWRGPLTTAVTNEDSPNLLEINQSTLRVNTDGWAAHNTGTISRDTAEAHSGLASLKWTPGSVNGGVRTTAIAATESTAYSWQAQVKATATHSIAPAIIAYDSAGAVISTTGGTPLTATGGWDTFTWANFTTPANTAWVVLVLTNATSGTAFWVDTVMFEQAAAVTDYQEPWTDFQLLPQTPGVLKVGNIRGDMDTPAIVEIYGVDSNSFGTNAYLSARANPIHEELFFPIKNFSGTAESGTYSGQFKRQTVTTSWTSITGETVNFNDVGMVPGTNDGWAAADDGRIFRTTDGWATASEQTSGVTMHLRAVCVIDANTCVIVGDGGTIVKTIDAGATPWSTISSAVTTHINCITRSGTTLWIGCSDWGEIWKSIDSGDTWTLQFALTATWKDIHAVDANNVFVCGYDILNSKGVLYKTTNGTDWDDAGGLALTGIWARTLSFASSSTGWIGCDGGRIYKTTNGGAACSLQTSGVTSNIYEIEAHSTSVVYAVGQHGTILKTTNGGTKWVKQSSGVATSLVGIGRIDADTLYVAGHGYTIVSTTTGGQAWAQPLAAWPLSDVESYRGTYRVWARVRTADATPASVQMRVSAGWAGGSVVTQTAVNLAASANFQWVYLGAITIPVTTISPTIDATPIIKVEAKGTGSANFDTDVMTLVGDDSGGELLLVEASATAAIPLVADLAARAVNKYSTNVDWRGAPGINLRPGYDNNIVMLETAGINAVIAVVKYYPYYLEPVS